MSALHVQKLRNVPVFLYVVLLLPSNRLSPFGVVLGLALHKVILDGNFIHCCISSNVDIQQRIASVLQVSKNFQPPVGCFAVL